MTTLSALHLRFDLVAQQRIQLGEEEAGYRFRNALASVLLGRVCPELPQGSAPSAAHLASCPACAFLSSEQGGEERRGYSMVPPLPPQRRLQAGQPFSLVLTLFGEAQRFLPYVVLAMPEVGREGVGPGRGQFAVQAVWALNPLTGAREAVVAPGESLVTLPHERVSWPAIQARALTLPQAGRLQLRFLTPTRLTYRKQLNKTPDFYVLFARLLERIDKLGQQHAQEERRPKEEVERLHALAKEVRLVDARTRWVELDNYSGRSRRKNPLSGFVGSATYHSEAWAALLPWLLLGQATQVGKFTVKGNGVFEVGLEGPGYWQWMAATSHQGVGV